MLEIVRFPTCRGGDFYRKSTGGDEKEATEINESSIRNVECVRVEQGFTLIQITFLLKFSIIQFQTSFFIRRVTQRIYLN